MPASTSPQRLRRALPFLFALTSVAVSFALLEIAARVLYDYVTPPDGRTAVEVLLGNTRPDEALPFRFHPYMLYTNKPEMVRDGVRQTNAYGHRGPEITPLPRPGVLRILALGGSTTYGHLLRTPEEAWPAQLGEILSKRLGREVEVVNGGLHYAVSADLLNQYMYRDRFLGARIVVIHTGGNDVVPLMADDYTPDYGTFRRWIAPSFGRRYGERQLLRSGIVRVVYAWWLRGASLSSLFLQPDSLFKMPPEQALANVHRNEPIGFERNVDALVRNVQDDGAVPVLFAFYLAEEEVYQHVEASLAYWKPYYTVLAAGVEKDTAVLETIARARKVPFLRIPPGTIPLDDFFDQCHLRKEGETIKATFVADRIEPLARSLVASDRNR